MGVMSNYIDLSSHLAPQKVYNYKEETDFNRKLIQLVAVPKIG